MDASGEAVTARVGSNQSVSDCVVAAAAAVTDTEPLELPPLYETVDADALNELCASREGSDLRVSFRYAGCTVTIEGPDQVSIAGWDD